ncbi:MAG: DNA internalization-related competence protein ComEC/Rec2, partial [Bacteroidota bacterium]
MQCIITARRVESDLPRNPAERRVLVHGSKKVFQAVLEKLQVGTAVRVVGVLEEYPRPRNPGDFDYGRYLELNDVHGVVAVRDSSQLVVMNLSGEASFHSVLSGVRNSLLSLVERMHNDRTSAFLRGILLADRSKIAADVKQAFVDTGTIHVLAVSGLHVGIVAVVFYGFFGLLRLSRRAVVYATMLGLLGYMLLTGSPPSVVRATIMALVLLSGNLFERKIDVYQSLGVAAILLLLWDTNNLFNVGFQLSFSAVFSIVYLYPIFVKILHRIPERFEEVKLLNPVLKLFAVSLAAQLGTLPFTAFYFDRISVVALLANLVVVPIIGFNVMLGFATLAFAPLSLWVAKCYAVFNEWLVSFLLGFVKAAASVPVAYYDASHFEATFPALYYVGLLGLVNLDNKKVFKFAMIAGLLLLNFVVYSKVVGEEKGSLCVTFVDVGQGDAILLEFPNGKNALIDAGPTSLSYDAGERIVAPLLKFKTIEKLDALIMSHPHSDHIGGVPFLLERFKVGRVIEPALKGESALYRRIHDVAQQRGVAVLQCSAGDTIHVDDQARLYVLHPYLPRDSSTNLNNVSLVVKLVYGSSELLLTGDAELEVERKLIGRYHPILSSDLLKVGHHGSNTSSSNEFVRTVQPSVAIISVGKENKFSHPSPDVIERFRQHGVNIHRTDKAGAV